LFLLTTLASIFRPLSHVDDACSASPLLNHDTAIDGGLMGPEPAHTGDAPLQAWQSPQG
jgi:hypothetical protein